MILLDLEVLISDLVHLDKKEILDEPFQKLKKMKYGLNKKVNVQNAIGSWIPEQLNTIMGELGLLVVVQL